MDSTLNRCLLGQVSCVSSYSEDEEHFYAPWEYETSTSQAIETVISIATGGPYRNVVDTPFARDRGDVAKFILQGTAAVSANR